MCFYFDQLRHAFWRNDKGLNEAIAVQDANLIMKHTIIIHIEYNGMQFLIAVPRFGITVHALINNCKVYQSRLNLNSKLQLYPPPP